MKLVIDSNCLQSDTLRAFLATCSSNFAVLTDYAAMEAYKGDTLASIYKSMAIVCEFPTQVIVLKGTRKACAVRGRSAGLQRRLIDRAQTAEFVTFAKHLQIAKEGNVHLQNQLLDYGRESTVHLDRMLADAKTAGAIFEDIARTYSKAERRAIRLGESYPSDMIDKIVVDVMHIATTAFWGHPDVRTLPSAKDLPNTFIFRVALCMYLLALDWSARGGAGTAAPSKFRNDFVDVFFAAYATYFDGLMTADAKLARIHDEARIWLKALFGCAISSA